MPDLGAGSLPWEHVVVRGDLYLVVTTGNGRPRHLAEDGARPRSNRTFNFYPHRIFTCHEILSFSPPFKDVRMMPSSPAVCTQTPGCARPFATPRGLSRTSMCAHAQSHVNTTRRTRTPRSFRRPRSEHSASKADVIMPHSRSSAEALPNERTNEW